MLDGTHYFECACGSPEHTIRFTLDFEKNEPSMIWCDFFLDHYMPWYRRIWVAFKYIFKFEPHNEHFASWLMRSEDVNRLRNMCDEFISKELELENKR